MDKKKEFCEEVREPFRYCLADFFCQFEDVHVDSWFSGKLRAFLRHLLEKLFDTHVLITHPSDFR